MANWRTVKVLNGPNDWSARLIESFTGATITAATPAGVRYYIPGPQDVGNGRCETQYVFGQEGDTVAYEWTFAVPRATVWSTTGDRENLVSQGHGNENAGFTSGTSVDATTEKIKIKVKGGHETSMAGSHRYDFEGEFEVGQLKRDFVHKIRHEVYWTRNSNGWYRARLDDGPYRCLSNIPTWPIGDYDGDPTTAIMWRLGMYPSQGKTYGPMELITGPMKFEVPE
jgi:hypothetical protein